MDGFSGGTNGYWRNRYYQRLDADDPLSSSSSKPPSARRRKLLPSSRRRKVAKFDSPPPSQSSSSSAPGLACTSVGSTGTASRTASTTRRRRFWRIRLTPRLAFLRRAANFPARLLRRLRHGYVRMMLKFSDAVGSLGPEMGGFALPRPAVKEYDEKVLVEIYRALVAQGHVLVIPAAEPGPDGVVSASRLVAR